MNFRKSKTISKFKVVVFLILLLVSIIVVLKLSIAYRTQLSSVLNSVGDILGVQFKHNWLSSEPSDINMYFFTAVIALVVLTGTAVSFLSFVLKKKVYGFTIQELLMYKARWYKCNFAELVIMNFLVLFIIIPFLYIYYSEAVCIFLLYISLTITYKEIKTIVLVFLDSKYILKLSKSIIINELDFANPIKWYHKAINAVMHKKKPDEIINEYSHVYKIFELIRKHTEESLDKLDIDSYRQNIELISPLSLEGGLKAVQNIVNSIEFGNYYEKVGHLLFDRNMKKELSLLNHDTLILYNCDPKKLIITNIKVAEMFSSHYSNALCSNLSLYYKLCLNDNGILELGFASEMDLYITLFLQIFNISQDMSNPVYARMNQNNWCKLMIWISGSMYKPGEPTELITEYVRKLSLSYVKDNNEWCHQVIVALIHMHEPFKIKAYIKEFSENYKGDEKEDLLKLADSLQER